MPAGRISGVKNYRNDKFLDILEVHLPTGAEQWKRVADLYHRAPQATAAADQGPLRASGAR